MCTLARRLALLIRDARSQTRMRASVVVMSDPLRADPTDVSLVEWSHPIQTLATNRAVQPFAIRIRLRRARTPSVWRRHPPNNAVAIVNDPSMGPSGTAESHGPKKPAWAVQMTQAFTAHTATIERSLMPRGPRECSTSSIIPTMTRASLKILRATAGREAIDVATLECLPFRASRKSLH